MQANSWQQLSPTGTLLGRRTKVQAVWSPTLDGIYVHGGATSSQEAQGMGVGEMYLEMRSTSLCMSRVE